MSDDLEIVRRVQRGETQAFALLVEKYHRPLLAFICRFIRDESSVEELGQEVFLSAFRSLRTFDEKRSVPFSAWVFIIARNRCISELRRRRDRVFLSADEIAGPPCSSGRTPEELVADDEQRQAVAAALEQLPEPYRQALLGSLRGDSIAEHARAQGIAPGTAKSRLSRAREQLRRLLGERWGGKRYERV